MLHLQAADTQLFVHLTWGTQGGRPLLGNDLLRQTATLAVTKRIRAHFCKVLAIRATDRRMDMVASFPASLAVASLLRMAHDSSQEALVQLQEMMTGGSQSLPRYWGSDYTAHTMSAAEAAEAGTYLIQRRPIPPSV